MQILLSKWSIGTVQGSIVCVCRDGEGCAQLQRCAHAQGFLGWVAYLGAANAGVPLSIIVKNYGWNAYVPRVLSYMPVSAILPASLRLVEAVSSCPAALQAEQFADLQMLVMVLGLVAMQPATMVPLRRLSTLPSSAPAQLDRHCGPARRYFISLLSACGVALLLLAPMVNLKNFVQREAAKKAKLA